MNSKSTIVNTFSSLKSKISKRNLTFSSNDASENNINPENNSSASIKPLLSVSHILNIYSFEPKIYSYSVKSIENVSQTDLNEPWYSLSFDNELFNNGFACGVYFN